MIYKFGFLGTVVISQSFSHSSRGNEHRVKTHGLIRCFKIILARVSETKILHVAKKISAQPTARKKSNLRAESEAFSSYWFFGVKIEISK